MCHKYFKMSERLQYVKNNYCIFFLSITDTMESHKKLPLSFNLGC